MDTAKVKINICVGISPGNSEGKQLSGKDAKQVIEKKSVSQRKKKIEKLRCNDVNIDCFVYIKLYLIHTN